MMYEEKTIQEWFLCELCKSCANVSVFLINGIKLQGVLVSHDENVVMLKNAVTQMVFKRAISTIVPEK